MNIPNVGDLVMTDDCLFCVGLRTRKVVGNEIKQILLWNGPNKEHARAWELSQVQPVGRDTLLKMEAFTFSSHQFNFEGRVTTIDNCTYIQLKIDEDNYGLVRLPDEGELVSDAAQSLAEAFSGVIIDESIDSKALAQWQ